MNINQRIVKLLDRYTADECSEDELTELLGYLHSNQHDDIFGQHIIEKLNSASVPGADLEDDQSDAVLQKVFSVSRANPATVRNISIRRPLKRVLAAAAIIAVVIAASIAIVNYTGGSSRQKPFVASLQKNTKRVANTTGKAIQVRLEDGSRITLQPAAALTYPVSFGGQQREVLLEGDAFFDIARDPEHPFLVYHGDLITRVLGTSFYIRSDNDQHEAEVEVTHGKVEVYENPGLKKNTAKNNGVIITPNEKVVYTEAKRLFSTSLVDNPMPITKRDPNEETRPSPSQYDFDGATLTSIIGLLKESYGIEIELENEKLRNCLFTFTGDLSDQSLYSKLDIICQAIGASYEVKGTKILIKGKGCDSAH